MTIADKLTQIAENTPKVYEAGKAEGIEEGRKSVEESVGERLDEIIEVQNGLIGLESAPEIVTPDYVSEGLEYESETQSYSVIGRGSCSDSVIVIPETFDDGVHGELSVMGITGIGEGEEDGAFANDQTIEEIVLPESGAYINWNTFKGSSLKSVRNYSGGASFWSSGLALEYVSFIDGVGIDNYYFWEVNRALTLDFTRHTAVPELTDTEYLAIHPDLKILVPLELYGEWIAATNWAKYSEYIVPARAIGDTTDKKLDAVDAGVDLVHEAGRKAEYDAFWDAFQENGNRKDYSAAFQGAYWSGYIYNPKYPIAPTTSSGCMNLFAWNTRITDTKVPITISGDCSYLFSYNYVLKRVPKLIFNGVTKVTGAFDLCRELEELYCEGVIDIGGINLKDSTKLSKASIESIIAALEEGELDENWNSLRPATSITLSLAAVNKAFETSEGANDGADNYEFIGLLATPRTHNWTINLV